MIYIYRSNKYNNRNNRKFGENSKKFSMSNNRKMNKKSKIFRANTRVKWKYRKYHRM